MPSRLRKLAALDARGWRDLLRAQLALLRASWRLRRVPVGRLAIREAVHRDRVSGDAARAAAVALAVERASTHGLYRPRCLARSLALRDLLVADGVEGASIRIGVRRHRGEFQAHAWVRWGDAILGDSPVHVAAFTEVDDLSLVPRL